MAVRVVRHLPVRMASLTQTRERYMPGIELGNYLRGASQSYHDCIEVCAECLVACEMCADGCLQEDSVKMLITCIQLDRDCADACTAAIRTMARGGPLSAEVCRACAVACEACAEECERHASHHEHCRVCAEVCRRCAEECRRMAAAGSNRNERYAG